MNEIALHLLDIVQNSVRAQAGLVSIRLILHENGVLEVTVEDDGRGMSPELLSGVTNPFVTTRTTRRVGLGIPLLQQNCEASGGSLSIVSREGEGTAITARFHTDSIDCLPLGDIPRTMATLILGSPDRPDFALHCASSRGALDFSTREMREALGPEVSLAEPEVISWITQSLGEEIEPIFGGIIR